MSDSVDEICVYIYSSLKNENFETVSSKTLIPVHAVQVTKAVPCPVRYS